MRSRGRSRPQRPRRRLAVRDTWPTAADDLDSTTAVDEHVGIGVDVVGKDAVDSHLLVHVYDLGE
jgi:hypothetical protein